MPRCDCSGSSCQCLILAGQGIEISGSGNTNNPYVITSTSTIAGSLVVQDTATVDLTAVGAGTPGDPFVLTATATVSVEQLTNVSGAPPDVGDTLSWDGSSWVMAPPPVAPAGAVNVGGGLLGNGSVGNPVRAAVSGVWGTAPLDTYGPDSTVGRPIYVDANGQLRAQPIDASEVQAQWDNILGKPSAFPTTWDQVSGKPTSFPTVWTQVTGRARQHHAIIERIDVPGSSAVSTTLAIPASVFAGAARLVVQATTWRQSTASNFLLVSAVATSLTQITVVVRNLPTTAHFGGIYISVFEAGSFG
jgi:hypothetical protein